MEATEGFDGRAVSMIGLGWKSELGNNGQAQLFSNIFQFITITVEPIIDLARVHDRLIVELNLLAIVFTPVS
jgi:hypothetical protein